MPGYADLPDDKVETVAQNPVDRLVDHAASLARSVGKSLKSAGGALDVPADTGVEGLLAATDLPDLAEDDAIGSLAKRIDREADLWRNLALREMARTAWANRTAQIVAGIAFLGNVALCVILSVGVLLGVEDSAGRAILAVDAGVLLAAGALLYLWVGNASKRSQRETVKDALARADLAELRLHRLAVVLAWRKNDPAVYRDALARLEKDASR